MYRPMARDSMGMMCEMTTERNPRRMVYTIELEAVIVENGDLTKRLHGIFIFGRLVRARFDLYGN